MQREALIRTEPVTIDLILETGAERRDLAVSIYTPLIGPGRQEARQNRIRLSNQARAAIELLTQHGARAEDVRRAAAPLFDIAERSDDPSANLPPSLASFLALDGLQTFGVDHVVDEMVVAGPRFHTRPLLERLGAPGRCYLLTLSRGLARLWLAGGSRIVAVDVPDMPDSIRDLTQFEDPEKSVQTHPRGEGASGFHGHGAGEDTYEHIDEEFVRRVARATAPFMRQQGSLFVLAAPDTLAPYFEQTVESESLGTVDRVLQGSFDRASEADIRNMAGESMQEQLQRRRSQVDRRLAELTAPAAGEALTVISEIVQSAHQGRLRELLIAPEFNEQGVFDPATGIVSPCVGQDESACEDLGDLAAVLTLRYGGEVHVAASSESRKPGQQVCAILRG